MDFEIDLPRETLLSRSRLDELAKATEDRFLADAAELSHTEPRQPR